MSVEPGILCLICMECFNKNDGVDSTSCGHVYHSTCIKNWLARSNKCPKCRVTYQGTRKLFLDFDDTGVEEVKTTAKGFEQHYLALQKDYTEVNENIKQIKEEKRYLSLQVESKDKEIFLLQEKIKSMEAQAPKAKRKRKRYRDSGPSF